MKAVSLIEMLSVAMIALVLGVALAQRVAAGIFLILVAGIANTLAAFVPLTEISGTKVYAADGIFLLLGLAWTFRAIARRNWTIVDALWVCFGFCILFSWIRGVGVFGLNTATNNMREFFYLWTGVAYVASFEWRPVHLEFIHRCWVAVACVLFFIMMSRYFFPLYAIDLAFANESMNGVDRVFESERDFTALRVLSTPEALFLAQTALLSTIVAARTKKISLNAALVPLWFALVLVLQHRTVWVTTVLCFLLLLPRLQLRRPQLVAAMAGIALLATGIAVWVGASSSEENILVRSLSGAVSEVGKTNESTFYFRTELWKNYMSSFFNGSIVEYVFGQPFGTVVYSWIVVGRNIVFTDVYPHNFYVYCLYSTGILGVVCAVMAYVASIFRVWRLDRNDDSRIGSRDWALLAVTQLVYGITYGLELEQTVLIGATMGLAAAAASRRPAGYGGTVPAYARLAETGRQPALVR